MCRSCKHPNHKGLYLQQCGKCGHPSHYPGACGVGVVRFVPLPYTSRAGQEGFTVGCECTED